MSSHFRLKNHLLLAALATAYPLLGHTATAARVEFATGNVMAVSTAGTRPLARGSELNTGETINTGDGRAQLRFADGAMMSLQPQTEFRIDDYNYNGKNDGQEKGFFSLLRGGLRTISGYIGKGNRDAYKVTTSVATIGIRGTEWSGVLLPAVNPNDTELKLGTGEGAIEVCNAAGCLVVASGESAIVTGTTQPKRSDVRPDLPASSTTNKPEPVQTYSRGEDRTETGQLDVVVDATKPPPTEPPPPEPPKGFTSGSDFAMAIGGRDTSSGGNYGFTSVISQGSAIFAPSPSGNVTNITEGDGYTKFELADGGVIISAVDASETIGWGVWSKGKVTYSSDGTSIYDLDKAHFVVGKVTPAADLSGSMLNTMTGTYKVIGNTTPSSTLGSASLQSATLTAHFGTSTVVDLDMSVKAGSRTYTAEVDGMYVSGSTFNGGSSSTKWTSGGSSGTASGYTSVGGFFAGGNASHAGLSYAIEDAIGQTNHVTQGAIAFERESLRGNLPTGTGSYDIALAAGSWLDLGSPTSATIETGSKLTQTSGFPSFYSYYAPSASAVKDVGTLSDGGDVVLGWGRWTTVTKDYMGTTELTNAHYVIGKPMSSADITALNGYTGVFEAVGGTKATAANGAVGALDSAKLTVVFGGAGVQNTSLDLKVKIGGATHTFTEQGGYGDGGGKFTSSDSIEYRGMVAQGGKKAGLVYSFDGGNTLGTVNGAAGLNRTNKSVTLPPS